MKNHHFVKRIIYYHSYTKYICIDTLNSFNNIGPFDI